MYAYGIVGRGMSRGYHHLGDLIRDMANPEHRRSINPDSFLAFRDVIDVDGEDLVVAVEERQAMDLAVALLEAIALGWDQPAPSHGRWLPGRARGAIITGLEAAYHIWVRNRLFHYVDDYRHPKNLIRDMGDPDHRGNADSLLAFRAMMSVDFADLVVLPNQRKAIDLAVAVLEAVTLRWDEASRPEAYGLSSRTPGDALLRPWCRLHGLDPLAPSL